MKGFMSDTETQYYSINKYLYRIPTRAVWDLLPEPEVQAI
jgi:hypothetical protein